MAYLTLAQIKKLNKKNGGAFFDKSHTADDAETVAYKNHIIIRKKNRDVYMIYPFNTNTGRLGIIRCYQDSLEDAKAFIDTEI